ncbi:bZIP transcription factor 44-like [Phragmites australis]|uniref:bZIP transcription factor 44-like n=1 Tax=Phragmites australis TaxID=29695 RepID=UPI002D76B8E1|nr:bZIP transcription factor 44-like [Phragmites australis]
MASPGVVSSTVTTSSPSTGSEGACEPQLAAVAAAAVTAERKRKRKESNRLSAQRSRARKQRQVDDLTAQVTALRARNGAVAAAAHDAARRCAAVQAENALLRARTLELGERLQSLTDLIQCMDAAAYNFNPSPFAGVVHQQPPLLDANMYNYY